MLVLVLVLLVLLLLLTTPCLLQEAFVSPVKSLMIGHTKDEGTMFTLLTGLVVANASFPLDAQSMETAIRQLFEGIPNKNGVPATGTPYCSWCCCWCWCWWSCGWLHC